MSQTYNRYIHNADGSCRCEHLPEPTRPQHAPPHSPEPPPRPPEPSRPPEPCQPPHASPLSFLNLRQIDTGDLLVLAILALLLLDGEGDDIVVLVAAIVFLFF
ncbi:MAG: hypothetical protein PHS97_00320 [Oscillospiraceae bacterium]|nr:hypothetical protein [Oscillospiraceae bacterium]